MRDRTHQARQRFPSASPAANRDTASRLPYAVATLLALVTLAVFWQVQGHKFVLWDDGLHVYDNPYLQALTLDHLWAIWRVPYAELYIPLTYTLWALTAAVARGLSPSPTGGTAFAPQLFHTLNLLVHLLNVLVVWCIVRLLLGRTIARTATSPPLSLVEWAAGGGALLFAMHPIQVEAVAWVTGFKDVFCGLLSCVAIWQYLRYADGDVEPLAAQQASRGRTPMALGHYWLATGVFVLALLAKPAAVVVPVLAWILDAWGWPQTWRRRRPALLAWLGLAVLWGLFTGLQVQPAASGYFITPLWARPLIAGDTVAFYLAKLAVPFWLGPDYGRAPEWVLAQWWCWLTGPVPWGLAVWLWYKRTRVPWLVAAAGVLVAGLLPVLGLVPFAFQAYSTVADRYMYSAMLGPAVALAVAIVQMAQGLTHVRQRWLVIACVGLLGVLGVRSAWQAHYWHDTEALFEHELAVHPGSFIAHTTLGLVMAEHNRLPEAIHYYTEAIRLWPRNSQARYNLGNALRRQGKLQEAIEQYLEVLRLQPNSADAHNGLGVALADQGRFDEAISHYTAALELGPADPQVHYNLGNTLNKQGKLHEAIQQYTAALRLKPNFAEAHHNLAATLADEGRLAEAIEHYTAALQLRPHYVMAHYNLGLALAKQGRLAEARQQFTEVLRLDPNHAGARRFLNAITP
jgi:tetratricopeptide (TPR) repeat protein